MSDTDRGNDMNDRDNMAGAAEASGITGGSPARKWIGVGVLAAGVVLAGISFGLLQSRATAGSSGAPRPETPGGVVETGARQSEPTRVASRRGCGSGGGRSCCSAAGASGGLAALHLDPSLSADQSRDRLAKHYAEALGGPVTVEIKDYGCHQEAEVFKDGKLVKRLSISGGAVSEIG